MSKYNQLCRQINKNSAELRFMDSIKCEIKQGMHGATDGINVNLVSN